VQGVASVKSFEVRWVPRFSLAHLDALRGASILAGSFHAGTTLKGNSQSRLGHRRQRGGGMGWSEPEMGTLWSQSQVQRDG